tara:strand:- start:18778 stop:19059 length:282 start_codon:yes stop_codon:yes gene_type:complete
MGLVGIATLHLEKKIIHNGKYVGHIEDVVIDVNHRKHGLSKGLIREIINIAKTRNCYKVILNCEDYLINHYKSLFNEHLMYKQKQQNMLALYL